MLKAGRLLRLWRDKTGAALVELAICLPVVLLLLLGGLEVAWMTLMSMQTSQVAVTTADNAARVLTQMDESDIEEIFAGAEVTGRLLNLERNARITLSSVQDNGRAGSARGQMIGWQRCTGGRNSPPRYGREGNGRNDASLRNGLGPPNRRIAAQPGTAVMFVEVEYEHVPLAFEPFIGRPVIRHESAFNVRERNEFGISNVRGRPRKTC